MPDLLSKKWHVFYGSRCSFERDYDIDEQCAPVSNWPNDQHSPLVII